MLGGIIAKNGLNFPSESSRATVLTNHRIVSVCNHLNEKTNTEVKCILLCNKINNFVTYNTFIILAVMHFNTIQEILPHFRTGYVQNMFLLCFPNIQNHSIYFTTLIKFLSHSSIMVFKSFYKLMQHKVLLWGPLLCYCKIEAKSLVRNP